MTEETQEALDYLEKVVQRMNAELEAKMAQNRKGLENLKKYLGRDPKRSLERNGPIVWMKDVGFCAIYAPDFERIVAPTHDQGVEL